jgi:hypothetical protein
MDTMSSEIVYIIITKQSLIGKLYKRIVIVYNSFTLLTKKVMLISGLEYVCWYDWYVCNKSWATGFYGNLFLRDLLNLDYIDLKTLDARESKI